MTRADPDTRAFRRGRQVRLLHVRRPVHAKAEEVVVVAVLSERGRFEPRPFVRAAAAVGIRGVSQRGRSERRRCAARAADRFRRVVLFLRVVFWVEEKV